MGSRLDGNHRRIDDDRSDAGGDVAAQCAEAVDVGVEFEADALLVFFRELARLGDRFVERLELNDRSPPWGIGNDPDGERHERPRPA